MHPPKINGWARLGLLETKLGRAQALWVTASSSCWSYLIGSRGSRGLFYVQLLGDLDEAVNGSRDLKGGVSCRDGRCETCCAMDSNASIE